MKKTISIFLVLLVALITLNPANASETNTGVSDEDGVQNISQEEIQSKTTAIEKQVSALVDGEVNHNNARAVYNDRSYSIYVANYKQEKTNWCGPAVTRQTLSFHKAYGQLTTSLPSQTTLASSSKLGTTVEGTTSASIVNVLNSYKTTFKLNQTYIATDVSDKASPSSFFSTALKNQIKGSYTAPIILIDTGNSFGISQYKGVRYRHYNTIKAIVDRENFSDGTSTVYSATRVDPHYDSRYYGIYTNPIGHIYQAVSQADNNGANKVLIY